MYIIDLLFEGTELDIANIWTPELIALLVPGQAVRVTHSDGNRNNSVDHIRAIVDGDIIVFKQWSQTKMRWNYKCEHVFWYSTLADGGKLSKCK